MPQGGSDPRGLSKQGEQSVFEMFQLILGSVEVARIVRKLLIIGAKRVGCVGLGSELRKGAKEPAGALKILMFMACSVMVPH